MLFAGINLAHAEGSVPDKFNISIGAYSVFRTDATISLTEQGLGAGISISPEDTLGLDSEQTVLRLTGYYRFTKEHALNYSWYRITSQGNHNWGHIIGVRVTLNTPNSTFNVTLTPII